jgi:hypothetical protein
VTLIAPYRNITKWVILLILILGALILGIVLPSQLVNNPSASGSLELGALETQATPRQIAAAPSQEASQVPVFTVNRAAAPLPERNCTYPASYWFHHIESWPAQVIVNDLNYTKEDAVGWIESDSVDVFTLLFLHFHVAYLNILSGADSSDANQAMIEANRWLASHPPGSQLVEEDGLYGMDLAAYLSRFNDGRLGPGRCADESSSGNNGREDALPPVFSTTPSAIGLFNPVIATLQITLTPTGGSQNATRTPPRFPGSAIPTSTSRATQGANATATAQPPTATQPPPPTATQPPPPTATQPPPPTATQPPPPTPAPTQEPLPTFPPTEEPPPTAPPR